MSSPWMIVGLGNPGLKYAKTRHNVGVMVLEHLRDDCNESWKKTKAYPGSKVCETNISGKRCVLAVGGSYMNDSGISVQALLNYYSVKADFLIVIHDEVDIGLGDVRTKFGRSDNGHNGLKSIRASLGTGDFFRVRMGVGRDRGDLSSYVLKPFHSNEREMLYEAIQSGINAVYSILHDDAGEGKCMNVCK